MTDDFVLDKVLFKIKDIICIEKFKNTKRLIDTNNKLPDNITLKNVMILMTRVLKDDDKFSP